MLTSSLNIPGVIRICVIYCSFVKQGEMQEGQGDLWGLSWCLARWGFIPGLPGSSSSSSSSSPGEEEAPRHPAGFLIPKPWGNAGQHVHRHLQGLGSFQPHSCWPSRTSRGHLSLIQGKMHTPARPCWKWEPEHQELIY